MQDPSLRHSRPRCGCCRGTLKPRPPPDALDPPGVHLPTFGPEQGRDPPLAISAMLAGQADDRRRACLFLIPTTGSLGGLWRWVERLAGNSTGPSLGDFQFGLAMINPLPATGRAWQIPASASFKISLSQDQLVQHQIRDRLPKTAILLLQVLKTLGLVRTKAALFLAPAIVTLLRYAARATSLTNRLALHQGHLGIAQHADYLFRGVAFTAHFVLLARGQNAPHSLSPSLTFGSQKLAYLGAGYPPTR